MLFSSFVIALSLALSASAAPALTDAEAALVQEGWTIMTIEEVDEMRARELGNLERRDASIMRRAIGGVFICTDINWSGTCGYKVQPLDACIGLTAPWGASISSFGPDMGTACVLYNSGDCNLNTLNTPVFYPGNGDLRSQQFNDLTRGFKCYGTNRPQDQCMSETWPGIDCNHCCNSCNRSGQDCCPFNLHC